MSVNGNRRKYELRRRAESQAATRQRIVHAAVALHEKYGPAHTSVSSIAELAGVGRPTVYRHFPDERSLFTACTGHYLLQHPPPDPAVWHAVDDPEERLRLGLLHTYRWYRDTEQMMIVGFRDLPALPVLGEVLAPLFTSFAKAHAVLVEAWPAPASPVLQAAVGHALAFSVWHSLARDFGLSDETAVDLLTTMVVAAARWEVSGVVSPAERRSID